MKRSALLPIFVGLSTLFASTFVAAQSANETFEGFVTLISAPAGYANSELVGFDPNDTASNVGAAYLKGVRSGSFLGLSSVKKAIKRQIGVTVKRVLTIKVINAQSNPTLELLIEDSRSTIYSIRLDAVSGKIRK